MIMTTDERIERLQVLVPGCQFVRRGDTLKWRDERPMPSEAEIEAVDITGARAADAARQTLEELDRYLPRALEDTWEALEFDTTRLRPELQARLQAKREARQKIKEHEEKRK